MVSQNKPARRQSKALLSVWAVGGSLFGSIAAGLLTNSATGSLISSAGSGAVTLDGLPIAALFHNGPAVLGGAALGAVLVVYIFSLPRYRITAVTLSLLGYAGSLIAGAEAVDAWKGLPIAASHSMKVVDQQSDSVRESNYGAQAAVDVPPLLGALMYPGSTIVPRPESPIDRTYPLIYLSTTDPIGSVISYYQTVAPDASTNVGQGTVYHTTAHRPGDHGHVYIGVEPGADGVQIGIALLHDAPGAAPSASTSQQTSLDAQLAAAYGDLVYPNADLLPASGTSSRTTAKMQSDDGFVKTVAYFKSRLITVNDSANEYVGTTHRGSDGRLTTIQVDNVNNEVTIKLTTQ